MTGLLAAILVSNFLLVGSLLFVSWSIRREISAQISAIRDEFSADAEHLLHNEPSALGNIGKALGAQIASGAMGKINMAEGAAHARQRKPGLLDLIGMFVPQARGLAALGGGGSSPENHDSEPENLYR